MGLLLASTEAYKLNQQNLIHAHQRVHQRNRVHSRYAESEGPTKADFGDADPSVITREFDINEKSEKKSGWTNPLSWEDDGTDDDKILGITFAPLDEDYRLYKIPMYSHDEDVIETMKSEQQAIAEIKKRGGDKKAEEPKKESAPAPKQKAASVQEPKKEEKVEKTQQAAPAAPAQQAVQQAPAVPEQKKTSLVQDDNVQFTLTLDHQPIEVTELDDDEDLKKQKTATEGEYDVEEIPYDM